MNTAYWDLFWTTGMPEAWLMSRDQAGAARSVAGPAAERSEGQAADLQPGMTGGPAGPRS